MTTVLDTKKAIQKLLLVDDDGVVGKVTLAALDKLVNTPNGSPWPIQRSWTFTKDGDDLLILGQIVTAFGGGYDKGDDGETESGVMNDGRDPGLMGCALPIKLNEKATAMSPLALDPPIPWLTPVKIWLGDEANPKIMAMTKLIDEGPNELLYPNHVGDITVAVAHLFAPNMLLDELANNFEMVLNLRIYGVAHLFN